MGKNKMTETMTVQRNGENVEIESVQQIKERDVVPLQGLGKMTCVQNESYMLAFARRSGGSDHQTIREVDYEGETLRIDGGRLVSSKEPIRDAIHRPSDFVLYGGSSYISLEEQLK